MLLPFLALFLKVLGFFVSVQSFRQLVSIPVIVLLSLSISAPLYFANLQLGSASWFALPQSFLLGVLISLPFIFALEAVSASARLVDLYRGAQFGEQLSSLTGTQSSIMENFFIVSGIAAFFILDFHHLAFSLLQSTESLESIQSSFANSFSSSAALALLAQSSKIFSSALILSAPVLLAMILVDLFSSILSKALPQMSVVFEVLPLKLTLGISVLALAIYAGYFERPLSVLIGEIL